MRQNVFFWACFVSAMVLIYMLVFVPTPAAGAEEPRAVVSYSVFCTLDATRGIAGETDAEFEKTLPLRVKDGSCVRARVAVALITPIEEVVGDVFVDDDGDPFYIVRVLKVWYTLAWPGTTSNLPFPDTLPTPDEEV